LRLRRDSARTGGAPVTDPRQAGRSASTLWQLHASPGCPLTRAVLDGRRFRADEAIPLPTLGCRLATCRCHYTAVDDDQRASERRAAARRQPRLEEAAERRAPWQRRQPRRRPAPG
jgi:hypothetical protein